MTSKLYQEDNIFNVLVRQPNLISRVDTQFQSMPPKDSMMDNRSVDSSIIKPFRSVESHNSDVEIIPSCGNMSSTSDEVRRHVEQGSTTDRVCRAEPVGARRRDDETGVTRHRDDVCYNREQVEPSDMLLTIPRVTFSDDTNVSNEAVFRSEVRSGVNAISNAIDIASSTKIQSHVENVPPHVQQSRVGQNPSNRSDPRVDSAFFALLEGASKNYNICSDIESDNSDDLNIPTTMENVIILEESSPPPTINVNSLLNVICPLDIIFFKGTDIHSNICMKNSENTPLHQCMWNHVGLVVNSEVLPDEHYIIPNKYYVWSTIMSNEVRCQDDVLHSDIDSHNNVLGVQIRDLDEIIPSYSSLEKAQIGWGKLRNNPLRTGRIRDKIDHSSIDIIRQIFRDIHKLYGRRRRSQMDRILRRRNHDYITTTVFTTNLSSTNSFICNGNRRQVRVLVSNNILTHDIQWLICSDLIMVILQKMNIIDKKCNPSSILPSDLLGNEEEEFERVCNDPIIIIT